MFSFLYSWWWHKTSCLSPFSLFSNILLSVSSSSFLQEALPEVHFLALFSVLTCFFLALTFTSKASKHHCSTATLSILWQQPLIQVLFQLPKCLLKFSHEFLFLDFKFSASQIGYCAYLAIVHASILAHKYCILYCHYLGHCITVCKLLQTVVIKSLSWLLYFYVKIQ
jgi:hypothetical protein